MEHSHGLCIYDDVQYPRALPRDICRLKSSPVEEKRKGKEVGKILAQTADGNAKEEECEERTMHGIYLAYT